MTTTADVLAACDRVLEAADGLAVRRKRSRALAPLERGLARRVGRIFALQQAGVLRRLAPLRGAFPVPVREALSLRDVEALLDGVFAATRRLFGRAVQAAAEGALVAGGAGVVPSFTLEHPRAVAFLREYGASRVTLIDETTRAEVRAILVRATEEGWGYQRAATSIADYFIGLRTDVPSREEAKAIRSRARLIAATEVGEAYSHGSLLAAHGLADEGMTIEKSWLTAGDDRVSGLCRGNAGAGWIGLAAAFPSGHQRPLGHPSCRCALLSRVLE